MRIKDYQLGFIKTNAYVGMNENTKEAFVVDPGTDTQSFVESFELEGYDLKAILLTHGHFDHVGGVQALVEKYRCPVYALEAERELLATPSINLSGTTRNKISITEFEPLSDGQELEVAGIKVNVIGTPGHTVGGTCYYVEENGVLFAGDTLFAESIGRADFPTGNYETLIQGIKDKLYCLPEDTIVYPGHMQATTIEHEKKHNPYTA